MEAAWRRTLIELVQRAVELGDLRDDLDVEQFVWELCGIYLGHHAAHRFLRTADADARAQAAFQALVDRALPSHIDRRADSRVTVSPGPNKSKTVKNVAGQRNKKIAARRRRR